MVRQCRRIAHSLVIDINKTQVYEESQFEESQYQYVGVLISVVWYFEEGRMVLLRVVWYFEYDGVVL